MAQFQVAQHARVAQVEIAIFQAQVLVDFRRILVVDHERRGSGDIQHLHARDVQLRSRRWAACGLTVPSGRGATTPCSASTYSMRMPCANCVRLRRVLRIEDALAEAGAIAQVHEDQARHDRGWSAPSPSTSPAAQYPRRAMCRTHRCAEENYFHCVLCHDNPRVRYPSIVKFQVQFQSASIAGPARPGPHIVILTLILLIES